MANEDEPREPGGRGFAANAVDPEESRAIFERIARLALRMAEASSAHIALSGRRRMWIAGAGRNQPTEDSRAIALAQLAVQNDDVLWIEDMTEHALERGLSGRARRGEPSVLRRRADHPARGPAHRRAGHSGRPATPLRRRHGRAAGRPRRLRRRRVAARPRRAGPGAVETAAEPGDRDRQHQRLGNGLPQPPAGQRRRAADQRRGRPPTSR